MKVYFRLTKWSSSRTPTNLIVFFLIHNKNWQPIGSKPKGTNDKNNIPVITYHIPLWTSPIKCHPSFPSVPLLSFDHPTDTNHPQPITSINYDRPQQLFYFNLIEFALLPIYIHSRPDRSRCPCRIVISPTKIHFPRNESAVSNGPRSLLRGLRGPRLMNAAKRLIAHYCGYFIRRLERTTCRP